MGVKVAVVGGGSTYTPELVEGFVTRANRVPLDELVLLDVDPERLEVVGGLAGRMLANAGYDGSLTLTGDRDRALEGADFVVVQLRVGGQAARYLDETIPPRFGCIGQETTGPGGFAKALRTVPIVLELAEETAKRSAPGAWFVDFTNPTGLVTQALLDEGHRAIGLCNVAIGFQRRFAEVFDVEPELLERRGGAFYSEAAAQLIASLHEGTGDLQVVNVRNDGALPDLTDDAVVEILARIDREGAHPIPIAPLAPEMLGLVEHVKAYERLAVEAATTGDRTIALKALMTNPLVRDYRTAVPLLDALLEGNRQHLPRFFPGSPGLP